MLGHRVYAYGTLQEPSIFRQIVGRAVPGSPATLEGYARFAIRGRVYPAIIEQAGARVSGLLYTELDAGELDLLDTYEGALYERREVAVLTRDEATSAFTYVLRAQYRHLLSTDAWDHDEFRRNHLATYLARIAVTARAP